MRYSLRNDQQAAADFSSYPFTSRILLLIAQNMLECHCLVKVNVKKARWGVGGLQCDRDPRPTIVHNCHRISVNERGRIPLTRELDVNTGVAC
jgi:hypothetical protein